MRLDNRAGIGRERRRRPRQLDDALLPLINIVFLLLVFFLSVGRLDGPEPQDRMPTGRPPDSTAAAPRLLVLREDGQLSLDGSLFSRQELPLRAANWAGQALDLRAPASAPATEVLAILGTLRQSGVQEIRLLTVRPGR